MTARSWTGVLFAASLLCAASAQAATYGEIAAGQNVMAPNGSAYPAGPYANTYPVAPNNAPYSAGPYSNTPVGACPPWCGAPQPQYSGGAEGVAPGVPDYRATPFVPAWQANPRAYLPVGPYGDQPHAQVQLWSYGQTNQTTDPFNPWGLSTPFMFVPWSTPLSGWTNAQTWNWWRERSGALPRNW